MPKHGQVSDGGQGRLRRCPVVRPDGDCFLQASLSVALGSNGALPENREMSRRSYISPALVLMMRFKKHDDARLVTPLKIAMPASACAVPEIPTGYPAWDLGTAGDALHGR
jgi:hypothetical protein